MFYSVVLYLPDKIELSNKIVIYKIYNNSKIINNNNVYISPADRTSISICFSCLEAPQSLLLNSIVNIDNDRRKLTIHNTDSTV